MKTNRWIVSCFMFYMLLAAGWAQEPKIAFQAAQAARWEAIAKRTNPRFVNSKTMAVNDAVIALLEITPAESEILNSISTQFTDKLRILEIKNAFVHKKSDGSEQIVVSQFDRRPLLNEFRESVSAKLGDHIANFCADLMQYDATLALNNAEMRVYIEKQRDGRNDVVFERQVRNRKSSFNFIEKLPLDGEFNIRYRHLFSAAPGLTQKVEPTEQPRN